MQIRGFSLLELMVVVGVIAVIAMMAYPSYRGYIQKGYDTEALEEITSLELVLAQRLIDTGNYTSAGDTATILSVYGWSPATTQPTFDYSIVANSGCPTGITVCYTITAAGKSGTPAAGRNIVKTSWGSLTTGGNVIR